MASGVRAHGARADIRRNRRPARRVGRLVHGICGDARVERLREPGGVMSIRGNRAEDSENHLPRGRKTLRVDVNSVEPSSDPRARRHGPRFHLHSMARGCNEFTMS